MNTWRILILILFLATAGKAYSQPAVNTEITGQWTLDIENGGVGWLEVSNDKGYLDGSLLWKGGSVLPAAHVYFDETAGQLIVTRTQEIVRSRDADGKPLTTNTQTLTLICKVEGNSISGIYVQPDRNGKDAVKTAFTGKRMHPLPLQPELSKIEWGNPVSLFNGVDLSGWELINPNQVNGFKAENGILVNDPVQQEGGRRISYGNLRTKETFGDFNLKLEVNVPKGSNSGVYLRGMYEIQVMDSYGRDKDSHNMGALYSRIVPAVSAEKPAGEWQVLDMTLYKQHLTVLLNGVKIIDNQPVEGPTGGAMQSDVLSPGPIYLQGDHGKVMYRNLVLRPILR